VAKPALAVKHPRWEPDAGMPPVRFCAGAVMGIPTAIHQAFRASAMQTWREVAAAA
jgi:hypothetical protein